jgi:hypothetical protein
VETAAPAKAQTYLIVMGEEYVGGLDLGVGVLDEGLRAVGGAHRHPATRRWWRVMVFPHCTEQAPQQTVAAAAGWLDRRVLDIEEHVRDDPAGRGPAAMSAGHVTVT